MHVSIIFNNDDRCYLQHMLIPSHQLPLTTHRVGGFTIVISYNLLKLNRTFAHKLRAKLALKLLDVSKANLLLSFESTDQTGAAPHFQQLSYIPSFLLV